MVVVRVFFLMFLFSRCFRRGKKSNTGYFLLGECSLHSLNSFVDGFLSVLSSD